jgi:cyclin-dependent kinase regulatory subunit CKS1
MPVAFPTEIEYSDKYKDDKYEYRHVFLTIEMFQRLPKEGRLLAEREWRNLGVQ